ncbi:MAG: quinol dehydrogenase ferredoxin subunit NapH [Thiotrichales bacterium]|jgi:ferredoxin-type protein NapH|nr:quinol dehydrogenase ferredoxin subunit NapH [Thiotrichales bacterium]MBT3613938.1 quinol dehydrogenase ferredoxin subunit NapH [Thiotrichales bacterium]MBT3752198.1 quinol dehydrogenase ferredoxin subunit NapH [Thiotrichales bacterium]MBT3836878.1 quinol dehydrogenase ferredoxin subunit NapH [Thiotrichales bacterium]MBT4151768.1 quinol dehydrogenase ferredoxin subunit NapH [Thiotrichales bacterium]
MKRVAAGSEAVKEKGRFRAHKWLLLRRLSQISIIMLFLFAPLTIINGSLASSVLLETVPLTDPFLYLQTLAAGQVFESTALIGALLVVLFYLIVGGRVYCSWVCPMNMVTDTAAWLRRKLGLKKKCELSPQTRYWVLAMVVLLSLFTGSMLWELVNPVTLLQRSIFYSVGLGWSVVVGVFLYDLLWSRNGWCGHVCPMGAFYSLLGRFSLLRVRAAQRSSCNDCMDCFVVCPEPQVIRVALKGKDGYSPVINSEQCTNCGRCIDVCAPQVFCYGSRFNKGCS